MIGLSPIPAPKIPAFPGFIPPALPNAAPTIPKGNPWRSRLASGIPSSRQHGDGINSQKIPPGLDCSAIPMEFLRLSQTLRCQGFLGNGGVWELLFLGFGEFQIWDGSPPNWEISTRIFPLLNPTESRELSQIFPQRSCWGKSGRTG